MNGRKWTTEEIEWLVLYRRESIAYADIGRHLGRTAKSCVQMHQRVTEYMVKNGHIPTAEQIARPYPAHRQWTAAEDMILREAIGAWDGSLTALSYRLTRRVHRSQAAVMARLRFIDAATPEEPDIPDPPVRAAHRRIYDITPPSAREWQERKRREFAEIHGK